MKVDVASRHGRSFLGINVQYVVAEEIKVRTLSMFDDEDWDDENEMIDVIEVIEISQADTERNDVLEKTNKDELKTEAITSKLAGACITCGSIEVVGIRCGSHTLQLAVDDAIKKVAHLNSIINKGHAAAVEFRKRYVLKRIRELQPDAKMRKPVLDVYLLAGVLCMTCSSLCSTINGSCLL